MIKCINNYLADKYIKKINNRCELSEIDNEKLKFAINTIFIEVEKDFIIIVFFTLADRLLPLLISFITLMSIRFELGGLHCKKSWQCLAVTFTYFALTIYSADNISVSTEWMIIIDIIAFIVILIFTPINSNLRKIKDKEIKIKLKVRVSIVLLFVFISEILLRERYRNYIVWSLVFILIEILLQTIKILRKRCAVYE